METSKNIIQLAEATINAEANTILKLASLIDNAFVDAVNTIFNSKGRLIITGIGKSAIIAQKIVATLNSTGTPSIFMHAADAIHGDLGIVLDDDLVLCLSKSGNTPEIKVLIPIIKNKGNVLIAMVSNIDSFLAQNADIVLHALAENEACPNNLAPTSSTTAQLVLGDALAVCLLSLKGFTPQDFAKYHPGGALGKKLYMRVSDIANMSKAPKVLSNSSINEVIVTISAGRMGACAVVDNQNKLLGIITDGDLRRMMERGDNQSTSRAEDIMTKNPMAIAPDEMAIQAFYAMENKKITQLAVVDNNQYVGMIHLHDILREGIV